MFKTLLISLFVFIIIAAGSYSIFWFTQASQMKKSVEQAIAVINKKKPYITYNSIETSGFPSNIYVSIVNPHFYGRFDQMLKELSDDLAEVNGTEATQTKLFASLPEWNEDIVLDGKIVLGINTLSDHYSYRVSGNIVENGKVGGQPVSVTIRGNGEDSYCSLNMTRGSGISGLLWSFQGLLNKPDKLLKDFSSLDCYSPGSITSKGGTHEKLASMGAVRIYITNNIDKGNQETRFYIKSADSMITAEGDKWLGTYMHALSPAQVSSPHLSALGPQNMELDFSYKGPSDWKHLQQTSVYDINLNKLELSNQTGMLSAIFLLGNHMDNAARTLHINYKIDASFNEQYDKLLQEKVHDVIRQIYSGSDPRMALLPQTLKKDNPDQFFALVSPAIPNMHTLGHLIQSLDLSYTGNAAVNDGNFNLLMFELTATPYGITAQGNGKLTKLHTIPLGNLSITCRNCLAAVDDAAAYLTRVKNIVAYFDPDKATWINTDPQLIEGIKGFLSALGKQNDTASDNGTLTYNFVSDEATGGSINGKHSNEVLELYNQQVAPYLHAHTENMQAAPGLSQE